MRRTAGQIHAIAGVQRQIRACDANGKRKYLQDFTNAYRRYERVLGPNELQERVCSADLLLIGDYHALPASQNYTAGLIERLSRAQSRPIVFAVETVLSRDQHILDDWWNGEIRDEELRERLRFDADWGYEWEPFCDLLRRARKHVAGLYGLDCLPREDLRKIAARDRHAAQKLAEIRQRHAGAQIIALFGESHLAPNHLPRLLAKALPGTRVLTLLQNVDSLYWCAAGERHERVEAVEVSADVLCAFNATPLEKYESYRFCLDRWRRERTSRIDLGPTIHNLIQALAQFLAMDFYSPHNTTQPKFLMDLLPEVQCQPTEAQLKRQLLRRSVSEQEIGRVLLALEHRGSAYVPAANTFYVNHFLLMHAAEEVARFLHHACRGLPSLRHADVGGLTQGDRFYLRAMECSVAYIGSRILCPGRASESDRELYEGHDEEAHDAPSVPAEDDLMLTQDFLVLHREFQVRADEFGQVPEPILGWVESNGIEAYQSASRLGNMLGSDIYRGYLDGRITRAALRQLFLTHLEEPNAARSTYFGLARKVGSSSGVCVSGHSSRKGRINGAVTTRRSQPLQ